MNPFKNIAQIFRMEIGMFRRFPKLTFAIIGIAIIPALYALIYLKSIWDPASQTSHLPAAIVNLDQGAQANGQAINIGADLVKTLQLKKTFGFYDSPDAEQAKLDVRQGKSLFALIIPADFSANAMSASAPGSSQLVVYASEGNNYAGAGFAKRFASELSHQVNETLNEKRWSAVLDTASSSANSLERLHQGVAQLQAGAAKLQDGLKQAHSGSTQINAGASALSTHVTTLTSGVKQLGAGAKLLDAKKPASSDLQAIKTGAAQLTAGNAELQKGLPQLEAGARKLGEGAAQLRDQSKSIPFVGGKVSGGAGQLADGANQLLDGLHQATQGQTKLANGAQQLEKGVDQLADGFAAYSGGVSTLASKFPDDAKMDELAAGSHKLAQATQQLNDGLDKLQNGSGQLNAGLRTLASALPAHAPGLNGTAEGLANTVEPRIEIDAPVPNNGMGFLPNFIPVALWLGAVMTAFVFHLRQLPLAAKGQSRFALLLGKLGMLWSINTVQALLVLLMAAVILGLHAVNFAGLALTMVVSSLTFMLIILALVRLFGDSGKAVSLVLLILQLSSAGGIVPIELTNKFYQTVSPWLPFTWSVRAVRASAFGAFGSEWGAALGVLAAMGVGAFVFSMFVGRWKFVTPEEHRPAMDI